VASLVGQRTSPGQVTATWNGAQTPGGDPDTMPAGVYTFDIFVREYDDVDDPERALLDETTFKAPYASWVEELDTWIAVDEQGNAELRVKYRFEDDYDRGAVGDARVTVLGPDLKELAVVSVPGTTGVLHGGEDLDEDGEADGIAVYDARYWSAQRGLLVRLGADQECRIAQARGEEPPPALGGDDRVVAPVAYSFAGDGTEGEGVETNLAIQTIARFQEMLAPGDERGQFPPPAYDAVTLPCPAGGAPSVHWAQTVYSHWVAQANPEATADAAIAYVGHGGVPSEPVPPDYTVLSLDGVGDGRHEIRGGRPGDSPQNDADGDVYYICNLPAGAFSRCRLVTFLSCHSAHHTAVDENWPDLRPVWEEHPEQCGCACHAALAKGARCVLGWEYASSYPWGWQWGVHLWRKLNQWPVTVEGAQSMADTAFRAYHKKTPWEPWPEFEAFKSNLFVGGDSAVTIRPAGWAEGGN